MKRFLKDSMLFVRIISKGPTLKEQGSPSDLPWRSTTAIRATTDNDTKERPDVWKIKIKESLRRHSPGPTL